MNLDRTFCVSSNCKDACGRQFTAEVEQAIIRVGKSNVSMAYFCGELEEKGQADE